MIDTSRCLENRKYGGNARNQQEEGQRRTFATSLEPSMVS
jgi:hypothetical protein